MFITEVDADLTQVITVDVAGTPVQSPDKSNPTGWHIKASPTNTGNVFAMFHGQTKALKGFPLGPGESAFPAIENLSAFDFDTDTAGNKIHAMKV